MIPVRSSAIAAVGYDPGTRTLRVQFHKSGMYTYHGVPQQVYDNFIRASSVGRYYDQFIKGRY